MSYPPLIQSLLRQADRSATLSALRLRPLHGQLLGTGGTDLKFRLTTPFTVAYAVPHHTRSILKRLMVICSPSKLAERCSASIFIHRNQVSWQYYTCRLLVQSPEWSDDMKIKLLFFARARELAGTAACDVDILEGLYYHSILITSTQTLVA